jgi:mannitol/fructose-specific phosphotransferase system IIA component (Ntr-type)
MKKILNQLIQIQDLEFIRLEQSKSVDPGLLADLEESIRELLASLPEHIAEVYRKLQQRRPPAVAAAVDGRCSACSMAVPTIQHQAIQTADGLQHCQHCKRILYYLDVSPRQTPPSESRGKPHIGIARFSSVELLLPGLVSDNSEGVIQELIQLMARRGFVDRPDLLFESALRREAIASTALGAGIAFPHVRGVEGGGLTFALGTAPNGVAFGPASPDLVFIVFFLVIPTAASGFYLRLLSGLIEALGTARARRALVTAKTPETLWRRLADLTRTTVP